MAPDQTALIYPDVAQALAFYKELMARLGFTSVAPTSALAVVGVLQRMGAVIRDGGGDVFWIAAQFLFDTVRTQPFGPGSSQTGVALTLAFLLRNGVMIAPPEEEEILGVVRAVADGAVYVAMVEEWLRQCAIPATPFLGR